MYLWNVVEIPMYAQLVYEMGDMRRVIEEEIEGKYFATSFPDIRARYFRSKPKGDGSKETRNTRCIKCFVDGGSGFEGLLIIVDAVHERFNQLLYPEGCFHIVNMPGYTLNTAGLASWEYSSKFVIILSCFNHWQVNF